MANRFALGEVGAMHLERPLPPADGTRPAAVGAGLVFAQGGGLLFEQGLHGAFGQTGGGGSSDLLHGGEIDIQSGTAVAEGAAGDDLAPLGREVLEFPEFGGGERAACHDASCLGVRSVPAEKMLPVRLRPRTCHDKAVHGLEFIEPTPPGWTRGV
jgi:hypothetical protein